MNAPATLTAAQQYDRALRYGKNFRKLSNEIKRPQPTALWPPENIVLLERYREWLMSGGMSLPLVGNLYVPMAGHVLSINLKPHPLLNLTDDFQPALDYVRAKDRNAHLYKIRGNALDKFRQFLRQQRGQIEITLPPIAHDRYTTGLPAWLIEQLERYQRVMETHWRSARLDQGRLRFWSCHTSIWQWACHQRSINSPLDVKRQDLLDYVDHMLKLKYAASTTNNHLRSFHAFVLYLQEQDFRVPLALLRIPWVKQPDRLPRFLTDDDVRRLRDDFEQRVIDARYVMQRRDALLDRAIFYLMWQGGLRRGEVEELRLEDLDLPNRKLMVRQGKNRKDRAVYVTDTVVRTLQAYLGVRGQGESEHVFLYRHRPICKDLIWARIKSAGERVGVKVSPHRLRHTCATQLLNAGCKLTSIQQLLGHREISSTLIYARVHDQTVADDYYAAMQRIEKSLEITAKSSNQDEVVKEQPSLDLFAHAQLLNLIDQLAVPQLEVESRLKLIDQMRGMLKSSVPQPAMIAA